MTNFPRRISEFLQELKRRRVFQAAALYAGAAFVVVQVADIFVPALGLPPWTMTLLVVLVILGLPIVLAVGWAFDYTAGGLTRTDERPDEPGAAATAPRQLPRLLLAAVIVMAVAGSAWFGWRQWRAQPVAALDADVVAVVPFRVAGAEPALAYLREGMLDLMAAKLTGQVGPRAVDPRTLISAWRRAPAVAADAAADLPRNEALLLARGLGAGRLVLGEVVSLPGRVVLTASLTDVLSGRTAAPVSVDGPLDSLPAMVDRLVAGLLSVGAGEGERLGSLTTSSLPALRLYLEGQAAYRGGRYDEANARFSSAVEIDSTFALAALMVHRTATWLAGAGSAGDPAALALAWRHRERLSPPDRAYLSGVAGPRYPAYTPVAEWGTTWESLVRSRPDSPEVWFEWGDFVVHWGTHLGLPDSTTLRRSMDAFERVLALDSAYLPALGHLFDIAVIRGDTSAARSYAALYLARDPHGLIADGMRNATAAHARGMDAMPEIIARVDSVGGTLRRYSILFLSLHVSTLPQAFALADHLAAGIDNPQVARELGVALTNVALNRGRPGEAARLFEAHRRAVQMDTLRFLAHQVRVGLHADGGAAAAATAGAALSREVARTQPENVPPLALCVLGQWEAERGDMAAARVLSERLRATGAAGETFAHASARLCAELLETWDAAANGRADAAARIDRLDALVTTSFDGGPVTDEVNLVLARLLESRGDLTGAFRTLGRYTAYTGAISLYRSTYLRERGRLAALIGDTAAAVDAYRTYLEFRTDPEPALRPDVEHVRAELARLTGEAARR